MNPINLSKEYAKIRENSVVSNTEVFGLERALKTSGYPMKTNHKEHQDWPYAYQRGCKLGNAKSGSGHDNFLKGIIVQADLTAPQYFWPQWQRYHFQDIVSSQSKMHRITKMDMNNACNEYVLPQIKDIAQGLINVYNEIEKPTQEQFQKLISNIPLGLNLTAGITTNYLQCKGVYNQRRGHKLKEWKMYCDWIESLPLFDDLCLKKNK